MHLHITLLEDVSVKTRVIWERLTSHTKQTNYFVEGSTRDAGGNEVNQDGSTRYTTQKYTKLTSSNMICNFFKKKDHIKKNCNAYQNTQKTSGSRVRDTSTPFQEEERDKD